MLTLYYAKGSSALAAHILLEEIGVPYLTKEVSIAQGDHRRPTFLSVNPKGRLPALGTPQGVLTENPAILEFIATIHPEHGLLPATDFKRGSARALCSYLCSTVHVAFAHGKRGARWADDPLAITSLQQKVPENLRACAQLLEDQFGDGPWALGAGYTYVDPYLFLVGRWMGANALDLSPYPNMFRHHAAMLERPATQRAMAAHGLT